MSSNLNANHQGNNHHNFQSNLDHDHDQVLIRASTDSADDKEDCQTVDSDPNNTSNENSLKNNINNGNSDNGDNGGIGGNNGDISSNNNVTNQTTQTNKVERIEECINQCLSDKSKKKISNIINNVIELTDIEKVYLYLKLPTGASEETDNFKLKGNAFSKNKADLEVSKTYIWIKSHLEEDSSVSLPKHEVYEEYKLFCEANLTQPICQADFGKLMKHMFPSVKPRRLGQRGNSRYCYSGLRKKVNFDKPTLPDVFVVKDNESINNEKNKTAKSILTAKQQSDQQLNSQINTDKHKIESASSYLVLEWARKLFNLELTSIRELAKHLILLNHIDKKSMAALTVIGSDDTNDKDEFHSLHDLANNQTNVDQPDQLNGNSIKGRKVLENVKLKTKPDALKLLNPIDTSSAKKEKQQRLKKLDKDHLKLNYATKKQVDTNKLPKILKIKKTKIKKENLKNDKNEKLKQQSLSPSALNSKIKLESFDNITNKYTFNSKPNSSLTNPIEINKTKNLIQEDNNQFIDNTQQFKTSLDFGLKRRHSTSGFVYSNNQRTNQPDSTLITDDINYKYQIKRQTSEQFDLNKKRLNLNQFSTDDLNLQSTNYLTNESTARNNQLVVYKKKYTDLKLDILNANLTSNLLHDNDKQLDEQTTGNANLLPTISESINANNLHNNQTISTQVDEQELYQFNNLYENGNQTALNQNQALINAPINNQNQGNLISYNETTATNMCNVNTQIPSIPASPISVTKDNPFATQFATNQMINDKVDFNNNNLSNASIQNYALATQSALAYTDDQLQMNNGQMTNQLINQQQKMFMNPSSQNLHNLLNKNQIANPRSLTRVRHSSGPSHPYSMRYSANNFLPNSNLNNMCSNSLSPLYENSIDNQKMVSFQNVSNHHSMKFNFSSNPASPSGVSEPMSPVVNPLIGNKKLPNLRFNKFGNLGQTKKDGTRSASFAGSNSSEPFVPFNRTRNRHMSVPYIMTPNDNATLNSTFSNSAQSLTSSLTNSLAMTPQNTPTTLAFNSDVFIPQQQPNSAVVGMMDDSANLNNMNINLLNTNQTNLNLQDNYGLSLGTTTKSNYEYPLSPPLTSNILNEEKSFTNHIPVMNMPCNLQQSNATRQKNFDQSIEGFNRDPNGTNASILNNSVRSSVNEPIDDILQDLKDLKYIE